MASSIRARIAAVPEPARQFLAYATIGAGTTSLDAALFALIVAAAGWQDDARAVVASTLSYGTASVIAYVLNSRIAFRAQHRGDSAATLARFAATFASSALLSAVVFSGVRLLLGMASADSGLSLACAKAASIVTVIVWNFTLLRLWVFRAATPSRVEPTRPADA